MRELNSSILSKQLKSIEVKQHKTARARGAPNKTEQEFNRTHLAGRGQYEALTFRLAGGSRYTPDWYVAPRTVVEVKGSYRFGSHGRALTAWREARAQFPDFRFVWAVKKASGEWEIKGRVGTSGVVSACTPRGEVAKNESVTEMRKVQS